jgi:uncharacterized membrane protein
LADLQRQAAPATARILVVADFVFTATTAVAQSFTGILLARDCRL